jgi:hypothetical protein
MRFVRPPDAIPHCERNNTYGPVSECSSRLVLLSNAEDFRWEQLIGLFRIVNTVF